MTNQELSLKILELVGGKENVTAATNCMTRLRVNLKDYNKADIEGLKATEGVLQVIQMDNLHVVLAPARLRRSPTCSRLTQASPRLCPPTQAGRTTRPL